MAASLPHDAQVILDELASLRPRQSAFEDNQTWLADFRCQTAAIARLSGAPDAEVGVRHIVLDGGLPLRIFSPVAERPGVILHLRGGGGLAGTIDGHDPALRALARTTGRVVVAPDYRLAPASPFPAQLDDALAALAWIGRRDTPSSGDQPIVVSGDSIGGALAASLAVRARSLGIPVAGQILLYPNTDLRRNADWPSRRRHDGKIIGVDDLERQIDLYLGTVPRDDPEASPLLAPPGVGAAPTLVVTCGLDPLADEGYAYVRKLQAEGTQVVHIHLPNALHGVLQMSGRTAQTDVLLSEISRWIDASLPDPILVQDSKKEPG